MRDIVTIFSFEFKSIAKKKAWIITTILFAIALFGATFLIRVFADDVSSENNNDPTSIDSEIEEMDKDGFDDGSVSYHVYAPEDLKATLEENVPGIKFYDSEEALKAAQSAEGIDTVFSFNSLNHYKEIQADSSPFTSQDYAFQELINNIGLKSFLEEKGVNFEDFQAVQDQGAVVEIERISNSNPFSYTYTYIAIFIVYMLVIFYGNMITTSVAREKSDRTMELLITSTSPAKLLFGKVFGAGLAGLLQFGIILLAAVVGLIINLPVLNLPLNEMLHISAKEIIVILLFIFLGYFMYLFIYAMLGSTVSKIEEAGQATMPIMMIFVASYIVVNSSLSAPESLAMKIASFVPFSAPIGMVARANLSNQVASWEIVLSAVLLIAITILFAFIGIAIYRLGSLNYGNRLKLTKAVKMLRDDYKSNRS